MFASTNKDPKNEQTERLIDSVTDDIMYAVSHGRTKPGKHMSLALAMKSLTGSRRVIDSLIRLLAFQPIHIGISGLLATVNFQNISLLNEYQMRWTSHFFGLICKATSAMLLSVGLQLHGIHLEAP